MEIEHIGVNALADKPMSTRKTGLDNLIVALNGCITKQPTALDARRAKIIIQDYMDAYSSGKVG